MKDLLEYIPRNDCRYFEHIFREQDELDDSVRQDSDGEEDIDKDLQDYDDTVSESEDQQ